MDAKVKLFTFLKQSYDESDAETYVKRNMMFVAVIDPLSEDAAAALHRELKPIVEEAKAINRGKAAETRNAALDLSIMVCLTFSKNMDAYWKDHADEHDRLVDMFVRRLKFRKTDDGKLQARIIDDAPASDAIQVAQAAIENADRADVEREFIKIAQNRITNQLPAVMKQGWQLQLGGDAISRIGKGSGQVTYKLEASTEADYLQSVDLYLLTCLQHKLLQYSNDDLTYLSIREYAELRGRSTTNDNLKAIREEALQSLRRLANLRADYKEKVGGKYVPSGIVGINGGTAIIKNGVICWNWNNTFKGHLLALAPMQFTVQALKADPRTNAFFFSYKIDQHYRMNEGKPNENIISVKTLLENAPNVQSIDEIKKTRQSPKRRIIEPFFRDLDSLDTLYYDVLDEDDQIVDPETIVKYDAFIKCKIRFSIEERGYESNDERVAARKKRAKKAAK